MAGKVQVKLSGGGNFIASDGTILTPDATGWTDFTARPELTPPIVQGEKRNQISYIGHGTRTATVVPVGQTSGVNGATASALPGPGYSEIDPENLDIVFGGTIAETVTMTVTTTMNDGTTATMAPVITATTASTVSLTSTQLLSLSVAGKFITAINFAARSSINTSLATVTAQMKSWQA